MKRLVGLLLLVNLAACSLVFGPLPPRAEPFTPPAVFTRWWAMTEACSGRTGDMGAVHWYRVPGSSFVRDGRPVGGYQNRFTNHIVIADQLIDRGEIVRHEMLHALLRGGGHPHSEFLGSCAPLVVCQGICVEHAGATHGPWDNVLLLPPESLEVTSSAVLLPRERDGQRYLLLLVTVRNPRLFTVIVAAPGDRVTPPTFGYDLREVSSGGFSGGDVSTDSSTLVFQPLEVKRRVFEFLVTSNRSDLHITPGIYLIRGGYARSWAESEAVEVTP